MALARPVRALGLATFCLLIFLCFQLLKNPPQLAIPGGYGDKIENMDRDPLLDRMCT